MTRLDGGNGGRSGVTLNHSGSRVGIAGSDGVYRIYDVKMGQEMASQDGEIQAILRMLYLDGSHYLHSSGRAYSSRSSR